MFDRGVRGNLLEVLKAMFNRCRIHVGVDGQISEPFIPKVGVLQGSVLSPLLFAIMLDTLPRDLRMAGGGVNVAEIGHINALLYADDVVIVVESVAKARHALRIVEDHARCFRYMWSTAKSVVLQCGNVT